jgi:TctA family transporter
MFFNLKEGVDFITVIIGIFTLRHLNNNQLRYEYHKFYSDIAATSKKYISRAGQKYHTDKHSKGTDSWTHLVSMFFCQF